LSGDISESLDQRAYYMNNEAKLTDNDFFCVVTPINEGGTDGDGKLLPPELVGHTFVFFGRVADIKKWMSTGRTTKGIFDDLVLDDLKWSKPSFNFGTRKMQARHVSHSLSVFLTKVA